MSHTHTHTYTISLSTPGCPHRQSKPHLGSIELLTRLVLHIQQPAFAVSTERGRVRREREERRGAREREKEREGGREREVGEKEESKGER